MLVLYSLPSTEFSERFAWTVGEICLFESFLLGIVAALQTKSIFRTRNCTTGLIFEPGKPPAFTRDTRIHKQFILGDRKWTVIRATTFPQFIEQFCCLIKTRLRITVNFITDEGIRMSTINLNTDWLIFWQLFISFYYCYYYYFFFHLGEEN